MHGVDLVVLVGRGRTAFVEMPSYLKQGDKAIVVEAIKPAPQIMAYR